MNFIMQNYSNSESYCCKLNLQKSSSLHFGILVLEHPGNKISKLGIRSSIGDTVISYWDNRNYAFKGSHTANHPDGRVYVKYDDGDEAWMSSWRVHKLITI